MVRYLKPRTGVPVFSPAEIMRLASEVNGKLGPAFDWTVVSDGSEVSVGGLRLRFSRTDHPGETLAVRGDDEDGASFGYSADTGPGWSLSELGTDLGLVLCEATLPKERERQVQHLSARQAGVSAKAARARRLVLTHLQPGVDPDRSRAEAAATFGQPVETATLHQTYEVRP